MSIEREELNKEFNKVMEIDRLITNTIKYKDKREISIDNIKFIRDYIKKENNDVNKNTAQYILNSVEFWAEKWDGTGGRSRKRRIRKQRRTKKRRVNKRK